MPDFQPGTRPTVPARNEGHTAHGRAVGQHALEKRRRLRLPRRDSGEHLHEERHHWVVGAEYLEKRYGYRDCLYPASQLTGEGGYYLNFLSDRKKTFFAALGLSALAGYETVNWGESLLPDGSRLTDEDNFIYGGALTLELSAYVTDKIVLLVNGRQRVLFGGDCGKFHTQVGVGIRFMIR